MTLLQILKMQYGCDTPILIDDVKIDGYSYDTIRKMFSIYVRNKEIKRFSQGVYYFPSMTELGESTLSLTDVLEKKYIDRCNETIGYYAGSTLLNKLGISTQVPNVKEITTNNEKTKKRTIKVNDRDIILRRPLVEVTNQNAPYLEFLDVFRYASKEMIYENKDKILKVAEEKNIRKIAIDYYLSYYPKTVENIIKESEIYDEIT